MGPRVSETGTLTGIALAVIAILAIITIVAIAWGARLKRQRNEAARIERERVAAEGGTPAAPDAPLAEPGQVTAPVAPAPPPVAPAPPPIADDLPVAAPPPPRPAPPEEAAPEPASATDEPATKEPIADEPIAAAAPHDASPATEAQPPIAPAPPPAPAAPSASDVSLADAPVTRIKGLGPKVAQQLADLGITTVGQLAALDARAAQDLDARLGAFTGRMARDRWIEQARLLAAGDIATFEDRFGKL